MTHEPLPHPGDVIDAWPPGVKLRERAPVRGWSVVEILDDAILLVKVDPSGPVVHGEYQTIPRASAWRRSER